MNGLRPVVVPDWRDCRKWLSTYGLAVIMAAPVAYENIDLLSKSIPDKYFHIIVSVLAVITFGLRIIKQK